MKYKKDTGGTVRSINIVNELNTKSIVLVALKSILSKCAGMIKKMTDNDLPDSYRTSS